MNDLIHVKLKKIVNLQDIMKKDNLYYKPKSKKDYNFTEYSLAIVILRDLSKENLSLKDANDEQNNFAAKIKNVDEEKKITEEELF